MKNAPDLQHIEILLLIVKHGSFRRAAKELNVSAPTLTVTINNLEEKLGVRLLNRSTRSLSLTAVGKAFLDDVMPVLNNYRRVIDNLNDYKEKPEGVIRINLPRIVVDLFFQSHFVKFKNDYPDINLALFTTDRKISIIDSGFDAGIRYTQDVPKDMVAIPFGGKMSLIPVASPDFLEKSGKPDSPKDLVKFRCINRCFPDGQLYRWEFMDPQGETMEVSVHGDLVVDSDAAMIQAAEYGLGIAFVYENLVEEKISENKLVRLLPDYTYPADNFCVYYPSRKHLPAPLRTFIAWVKSMNRDVR
ncbi:LysR family transcriptional regulator [Enterobacter asburiae]|jgi:DNA-binding transcriptional LysR family regulator|uniref:LysR family transcriptional regulator n=1 Tax=Enterobacter asburiae TaxID=61645 RepID=UPI001C5AFC71|nr:LysR family transcriptional regulator [Enterobacter asburiae]MBW4211777.1 LysR family transcriptional regulator [Enterobacter asburiae]